MWPRWLEVALAAWLAASPVVFGSTGDATLLAHDVVTGAVIALLALASLTRRLRRAHLLEIPVALWLTAFGWMRHEDTPVGVAQNHLLLGLVLLMTAILPSEATRPPEAWRRGWGER